MGRALVSEKQEFPEMENNAEFTDLQLIRHVRDALAAVTLVKTQKSFSNLPQFFFFKFLFLFYFSDN